MILRGGTMIHRKLGTRTRITRLAMSGFRLCIAAAMALTLPAVAQTVSVMNVSHPLTALEPGNTIGNKITGAAASSPITANVNGTVYSVGNTDSSGNAMITSYASSV